MNPKSNSTANIEVVVSYSLLTWQQ